MGGGGDQSEFFFDSFNFECLEWVMITEMTTKQLMWKIFFNLPLVLSGGSRLPSPHPHTPDGTHPGASCDVWDVNESGLICQNEIHILIWNPWGSPGTPEGGGSHPQGWAIHRKHQWQRLSWCSYVYCGNPCAAELLSIFHSFESGIADAISGFKWRNIYIY